MTLTAAAPEQLIVDVVNAWSTRVRLAAGIESEPPPALSPIVEPYRLQLEPAPNAEALTAIADTLYPVFAAVDLADRHRLLNDLVYAARPIPITTSSGPRWDVAEGRELEGSLLFGLVEHARRDPQLRRLGTCHAHRCADAYIDASQAGRRRYCSLTCQNRAKALSYRRRHRSGSGHKSSALARRAKDADRPEKPAGGRRSDAARKMVPRRYPPN